MVTAASGVTGSGCWILGDALGIDWRSTEFVPVEHHLAHASSAYHLSGFTEKTAIMGVDGKGEYATTFFGYGENGRIHQASRNSTIRTLCPVSMAP